MAKAVMSRVPLQVIALLALTCISAGFDALSVKFLASAIDSAGGLVQGNQFFFVYIIIYVLALYVLPYLDAILEGVIDASIQYKMQLVTTEEMIQKTIKVPLSYVEDSEYQNLLKQISNVDSSFLLDYLMQFIYMLYFVLKFIFAFVVFIGYNRTMSCLLMVNFIISVLVNMRHARMRGNFRLDMAEEERKEDYYRGLLTDRELLKDMKILGVQQYFGKLYLGQAEHNSKKSSGFQLRLGILEAAASGVKLLISYGAFALGLYFIAIGSLSAGGFMTYYIISGNLVTYYDLFLKKAGKIKQGNLLLEKYLFFMKQVPEEINVGKALSEKMKISFRDVDFCYQEGGAQILHQVSFEIAEGEKVVIVGENGAGKSTLIRLMTGLNKADSGQVLIGGTDVNELNKTEFWGRISIVAQDFSRYYLTLRENVGISVHQKMWDDEALDDAAEKGAAKSEIRSFKEGWDQKVGTQYKDGIELSGGQWQKLALSRAYFKMGDLPVHGGLLIMDEPTAALDSYNEEKVYHRFLELSEGCTSVFVSHRLASSRMADKILVMKEGRVIETGSHEELMALNRYYAELYRNQASLYQ